MNVIPDNVPISRPEVNVIPQNVPTISKHDVNIVPNNVPDVDVGGVGDKVKIKSNNGNHFGQIKRGVGYIISQIDILLYFIYFVLFLIIFCLFLHTFFYIFRILLRFSQAFLIFKVVGRFVTFS